MATETVVTGAVEVSADSVEIDLDRLALEVEEGVHGAEERYRAEVTRATEADMLRERRERADRARGRLEEQDRRRAEEATRAAERAHAEEIRASRLEEAAVFDDMLAAMRRWLGGELGRRREEAQARRVAGETVTHRMETSADLAAVIQHVLHESGLRRFFPRPHPFYRRSLSDLMRGERAPKSFEQVWHESEERLLRPGRRQRW